MRVFLFYLILFCRTKWENKLSKDYSPKSKNVKMEWNVTLSQSKSPKTKVPKKKKNRRRTDEVYYKEKVSPIYAG